MYENTMSKQIWILLIIIGILAGGTGGYFLAKNKTSNVGCAPCPKDTITTQITPTPTSTLSTKENQTETKSYTNDKYKFSLEYPIDGWQLNPTSNYIMGISANSIFTLISDTTLKKMENGSNDLPDFQIITYDSLSDIPNAEKHKTIKEYLDSDKMIFSDVTQTTLDDNLAYSTTVIGLNNFFRIYTQKDGTIYILEFGQSNDLESLSNIEKNILESFKFN